MARPYIDPETSCRIRRDFLAMTGEAFGSEDNRTVTEALGDEGFCAADAELGNVLMFTFDDPRMDHSMRAAALDRHHEIALQKFLEFADAAFIFTTAPEAKGLTPALDGVANVLANIREEIDRQLASPATPPNGQRIPASPAGLLALVAEAITAKAFPDARVADVRRGVREFIIRHADVLGVSTSGTEEQRHARVETARSRARSFLASPDGVFHLRRAMETFPHLSAK